MKYEMVSLIADLSLALSFVVALIFGIFQVRDVARDRRERRTMEALHNFQSREFAELSGRITYHKTPSNLKEFEQLPLNEQAKFIQFSEEMESLGILVADRLIEIDLVDKTLGSFVTTSWQKYKIIFEEIRKKHSDPFLGEYFQWLAEYINDRTQKNPRKPFYENHNFRN
jgi:hypothetical protein